MEALDTRSAGFDNIVDQHHLRHIDMELRD